MDEITSWAARAYAFATQSQMMVYALGIGAVILVLLIVFWKTGDDQ